MMREAILGAVYGITKSSKSFATTRVGGISLGHHQDIENTLIVTDQRLLFIAVPVDGAGYSFGGFDMSTVHSIFNRGGIRTNAEKMIKTLSLDQILHCNPSNFELPFSFIEKIKFGKIFGSFKITDVEGHKYKYSLRRPDKAYLKELIKRIIPEKVN